MGAGTADGLVIFVGRNGARYSDPADWERLIREERLKRTDVVPTRRGDGLLTRTPAEDVPELRTLFDRIDDPPPGNAEPEPAPPEPADGPPAPPTLVGVSVPPRPARPRRTAPSPPLEPPPVDLAPTPTERPAAAAALQAPRAAPGRSDKRAFPPWARALSAVLALVLLGYILRGSPDAPSSTDAAAVTGEAVAVYVTRETRIRPAPQGTGNTPIANVGRGERLTGTWETGADGRTPWLRITEGRHAGGYVWGPNLSDIAPPELVSTTDSEAAVTRAVALRAQPEPAAAALQQLEPGARVRVVGQLASGWYELSRSSGGVGYVPPEAFIAEPDAPPPSGDDANLAVAQPPADALAQGPPPLAAVVAEPVPPPPPPAPPTYISQPSWLNTPTPGEMARGMPSRALEAGQSGRAVMDCVVGGDGRLEDCRVAEEQPDGFGFGAATLSLARLFRMEAVDGAGDPVAGRRVRIPTRYAVD